jgi:hypothetical protein
MLLSQTKVIILMFRNPASLLRTTIAHKISYSYPLINIIKNNWVFFCSALLFIHNLKI